MSSTNSKSEHMLLSQSGGSSTYSEQGETYTADLIADVEAKAAKLKGKPLGYLLSEAAVELRRLKESNNRLQETARVLGR